MQIDMTLAIFATNKFQPLPEHEKKARARTHTHTHVRTSRKLFAVRVCFLKLVTDVFACQGHVADPPQNKHTQRMKPSHE